MEKTKNIIGVILLGLVILTFIIGGYFLMQYYTTDHNTPKDQPEEEITDLREDKTKDYVYYENGKDILEEEEIHQDEARFNFKDLAETNALLKAETDALYNDIKYIKDMELPTEDENGNPITYKENSAGIYSVKYRNYEDNKYGNYVSLLIKDYEYDIKTEPQPIKTKSLVVDLKTGTLITEEELFTRFSTNMDAAKAKIKESLQNTQILLGEEVTLNIDDTLAGIDENHAIWINKNGKLTITFIVKSSENNYNDDIEIN